jgi:hypothetical protein
MRFLAYLKRLLIVMMLGFAVTEKPVNGQEESGSQRIFSELGSRHGISERKAKELFVDALYADSIRYCIKKLGNEASVRSANKLLGGYEASKMASQAFWSDVRSVSDYGDAVILFINREYKGGCKEVIADFAEMGLSLPR